MAAVATATDTTTVFAPLAGSVVCIEGAIGVGKSTLGRALERYARRCNVDVHFEREQRHEPMLARFVSAPQRYGFVFQTTMLGDALNRQHTCRALADRGVVTLLERGAVGNNIFGRLNHALGNLSDDEYAFYESLLPRGPLDAGCDLTVYLHVSYDVALRRMGVRADPAEKGYASSYLRALNDAYFRRMVALALSGARVACVLWDGELERIVQAASALVDEPWRRSDSSLALLARSDSDTSDDAPRELDALLRYAAHTIARSEPALTLAPPSADALPILVPLPASPRAMDSDGWARLDDDEDDADPHVAWHEEAAVDSARCARSLDWAVYEATCAHGHGAITEILAPRAHRSRFRNN